MWKWDQSQGKLYHNDEFVSDGYSGLNSGKNNPADEKLVGIGPIPCGLWHMTDIYNSVATGPRTIILMPDASTLTFGRSQFRIHGDSKEHPGQASHGCIILPRAIREQIWDSNDRLLTVIE